MSTKSDEISKSLVFLFITIQLLFGANYGFFATLNKRFRILVNVVSFIFIAVYSSTAAWTVLLDQPWLRILTSATSLIVFTMLRFSSFTFYDFCRELSNIDKIWNLNAKKFRITLVSWVLMSLQFCCFIGFITFYLLMTKASRNTQGTLSIIPMFFLNMMTVSVPIVNTLIFYNVFARVHILKTALQKKKVLVANATLIFRSVAEALDNIRVTHDRLIIMGFVFHFIRCVLIIWQELSSLKQSGSMAHQVVFIIKTMYILFIIVVPAVVAEMVADQIDKMEMVIHNRLLIEANEDVRKDLERLLRYVEARPLLRKAWRLVPVDLRQPVALLSMSATYLIVLIQLTHVY